MELISLLMYCQEHDMMSLLDEWDYEKNECNPNEVSYGSNEYAWWKCSFGHFWKSKIGNRSLLKRGCPYCSGRKTLSGFNDFKTWCINNNREDLLKEWYYEKNDIAIEDISPQNNRKVWWKCSLGHEWDATIGSRTRSSRPSGCPYCSNPPKRVLVGFNDLESWCRANGREDLLSEWDYDENSITPKEVTFGSGKAVWWKCSKAHRWKTAINCRTTGSKTQCPICTRTQSSFPEQAVAYYLNQAFTILQRYRINGYEVDVYIPEHKIAVEYDGRFFHDNEHTVLRDKRKNEALEAVGVHLIRIKESVDQFSVDNKIILFPAANGKYITDHFEKALSELIRIIAELIGIDCSIDINMQRDELNIRAYYMNTLKENSVGVVYPELIPEWDTEKNAGVDAFSFSAHNGKKVWWKCQKGHYWYASINSRTQRKLGCPYCAGQRTIIGDNDLETWCKTNNPSLLSEWDQARNEISPAEYQKTSNKTVWWICVKGHSWQASIANRVHGTGCPVCNNGRNVSNAGKSLYDWCISNNQEQLLAEWDEEKNDGKTPKDYSYGSHAKVWWKCSKGHSWQAVLKSRRYNHGCPFCSPTYKKVTTGINDLVTWCNANHRDFILNEWNYEKNGTLTPEIVSKGSHKRVWWKCQAGHEWEAEIKSRTQTHGNTCPYCKKR